jgi:hypothetical protein
MKITLLLLNKNEVFSYSIFFQTAVNVNEVSVPLMLMLTFVIECFKFEEMRNYFPIIENRYHKLFLIVMFQFMTFIHFFSMYKFQISYMKMKLCMCVCVYLCLSGGLPPDLLKLSPQNLAWSPHFTRAQN